MVVNLANDNYEDQRTHLRTIDAEREKISRLLEENRRLQIELAQAKLELRLERQNKFATNQQRQAGAVGPTSGE